MKITKTLKVPIEVSARHIHLNRRDFIKLFGQVAKLKPVFPLSQKGQFASASFVTLFSKDKKRQINLRVLGPLRDNSQIELSLSDTYNLGYNVPLRLSGDIKNVPKIKVNTSRGAVFVVAIISKRHLHMPKDIAKKYGFKNNQKVSCEIEGKRGLILKNIVVRIDDLATLALHLDIDEGNACGIQKFGKGEMLKR
ncbi:MAG: PduL/EutD family phosphate acyltransferase [Candidatus Parcubacteria bacterium]|nr:PduL/EutD family phosphate acyltransferase [Candidatus Parcubacteria bacterium]